MNWKKERRGLKRCAWGIGIPAVALILVWVALDIASGIKLRRAIVAWQEAEMPSANEFLSANVPPDENAAVVLSHVIPFGEPNRLRDGRLIEAERLALTIAGDILRHLTNEPGPVSSDLVEELEAALDEPTLVYRRVIARQAVEFERFDAYLQHELIWETFSLPHVSPMRSLSRLMQAESLVNAVRGNWREAYEALNVSIQLGELLRDEPFVFSQMTRWAIREVGLKQMEVFLQIQPPDEEGLRALREVLLESEESDMLRTDAGETAGFAHYVFHLLETGEFLPAMMEDVWSSRPYSHWLDKRIFRPLHKGDAATYIDANRERIVTLRKARDRDELARNLDEWEESFRTALPWYALLTSELIPDWRGALVRAKMDAARLELGRTALAVHAFRNARDAWPESLADLVPAYLPEVPRDPFGGEGLRYNRSEERVVLYSIGPDSEDGGGEATKAANFLTYPHGDIVWVLDGSPAAQ